MLKIKEIDMDIEKLCKKVLEDEKLSCIPLIFVLTVFESVMDAISSGECFYDWKENME